jgi:hypothetical protein
MGMLDTGRTVQLRLTKKTIAAVRRLLAGASLADAIQASYSPDAEATVSFKGDGTGDLQKDLDKLRDAIEQASIPTENLPVSGTTAGNTIRYSRDQEAIRYHREGKRWDDARDCTMEEVVAAQRAMRGRAGMSFEAALKAVRRAVRS